LVCISKETFPNQNILLDDRHILNVFLIFLIIQWAAVVSLAMWEEFVDIKPDKQVEVVVIRSILLLETLT
jgi:hypothetical protein